MVIKKPKSFVEFNVIWKDHKIFEMKIMASSDNFSGEIEVYEIPECLADFAEKLAVSLRNGETLTYKPAIRNGLQLFSMKYYTISDAEKMGVEIQIEAKSEQFHNKKECVKFDIVATKVAIENFKEELQQLTKEERVTAKLIGIDN